jgi:hypothetical protein
MAAKRNYNDPAHSGTMLLRTAVYLPMCEMGDARMAFESATHHSSFMEQARYKPSLYCLGLTPVN